MKAKWYGDVNPKLDRLTNILNGSKPSHGYTISEAGPEIVTAPGVYFPAEKGKVIPLTSRRDGGGVAPDKDDDLPDDLDKARIHMVRKIISKVNPGGLENHAMKGFAMPPEPMKIEKTKYDILKSALSILRPQREASPKKVGEQKEEKSVSLSPRQMGGDVTPSPTSPESDPMEDYNPLNRIGTYLRQMTTMFSRAAGGDVEPPEDELKRLRRAMTVGGTTAEDERIARAGITERPTYPMSPEQVELAEREKWAIPGNPEAMLATAREKSPNVISVAPGFQRSYYEAHPEEKLMDEAAAANKPAMDAALREIEAARNRSQGFGLIGLKPKQANLARVQAGKDVTDLTENLAKSAGLESGARVRTLEALTPTATKPPAPHLVQNQSGEYVWATPGGVLPAGIMGKRTEARPGAPHPRTTEGGTLMSDPQTGATLYMAPGAEAAVPYNPKTHGEQEVPGVLGDEDAKMYAGMLAKGEMTPSQLRLVVQPFGAAGGQTKNKIFKGLKELNPNYNLKLAEAEYSSDTKALEGLSRLYTTASVAMGAAENHAKDILKLSAKVDRTGSPILNKWFMGGKKAVAGDKDITSLDVAVHAFDREFSRYLTSMTQSGQMHQTEANEMSKLIGSSQNPEQLQAAIQTATQLMQGKRAAFDDQFSRLRSQIGGGGTPAPAGGEKTWKQKNGTWVLE